MANVTAVALCPACKHELPHPIPEACPRCQHPLERPKNDSFESPDYLIYQSGDKRETIESKPVEARTPDDLKTLEKIEWDWRKWGRDAPMTDRIAAMKDAHFLLSWALHSNLGNEHSEQSLRELSAIASRIGGLGKGIDDYFRNGGSSGVTEPRLIRPAEGDDGGGEADPVGAGGPTRSRP